MLSKCFESSVGLEIPLRRGSKVKLMLIRYQKDQKLGLQGANTLSSVLENNNTLREVYCEYNDINLQAMTILVDSVSKNKSILYMPRLDADRLASLQNLEKEIQSSRNEQTSNVKHYSVRRTFASVKHAKFTSSLSSLTTSTLSTSMSTSTSPTSTYALQDVREALRLMSEKWDRQVTRLESYLERNYKLAHGIRGPDDENSENDGDDQEAADEDYDDGRRPTTGDTSTITDLLEKAVLTRTPTVEQRDSLAAISLTMANEKMKIETGNQPATATTIVGSRADGDSGGVRGDGGNGDDDDDANIIINDPDEPRHIRPELHV